VLSGTTTDYTYDASGNQTEASVGGTATVNAAYNGASELTNYENSSANMTAATYDGDGLRTLATTTPVGGSSSTQDFVWNTVPSLPELLMDSNNAYIYGPNGTPFEQVDLSSGAIHYLVADALGSVRGVVNSSGSLSASTSYDAWGNPETTGGLTSYTPFGFAGGYTDPTGLVYLIGRYYDPVIGQFLTVDALVDETGQPYAYTGDDPVNAVDPLGTMVNQGPDEPIAGNSAPCAVAADSIDFNDQVNGKLANYVAYNSQADRNNVIVSALDTVRHTLASLPRGYMNMRKQSESLPIVGGVNKFTNNHEPAIAAGTACLTGVGCVAVTGAAAALNVGNDIKNNCSAGQTFVDGVLGAVGTGFSGVSSLGESALENSPSLGTAFRAHQTAVGFGAGVVTAC
jgi:RHS repeat-associated protein